MANKILPVADALKQLYEALGGDDPEVLELSTNTELIQEIAKVAEGGGGGLPEVTEADNGRVLGVDDGEWKAVDIDPYAGYDYVIHEIEDGDTVVVKGSFDEIYNLLQDRKPVMGLYQYSGLVGSYNDVTTMCIPITWNNYYSSADFIQGVATYYDDHLRKVRLEWLPDGDVFIATSLIV